MGFLNHETIEAMVKEIERLKKENRDLKIEIDQLMKQQTK